MALTHRRLSIPDVIAFEPKRFGDGRGYFMVTYNKEEFCEVVGQDIDFVQDNESRSAENVLRGLHYQIGSPQDKLVRVVEGEIFDVAVDLRVGSSTFGKWAGESLSGENGRQLWVPKGFAHGFFVLSRFATVSYKVTDYWSQADERCIRWDDPDVNIDWPRDVTPLLSPKDAAGTSFSNAEYFPGDPHG